MFEHLSELQSSSKNKLAHLAVTKYLSETGIKMNKDWIYGIIRLGLYKDDSGFHFEAETKYSLLELCEHPSLIRK